MTAIYQCIEEKKIGLFESPTGTGKSLSIICGSLTWLRDFKRRRFDESLQYDEPDDDEPAWVVNAARAEKRQAAVQARQEWQGKIARIRRMEKKLKDSYNNGESRRKRAKVEHVKSENNDDDEAQFVLDDYDSDQEHKTGRAVGENTTGYSAETQALMAKVGMLPESKEDEIEVEDDIKIFYCSRTHSQLSQFAAELRKVRLPPSIQPEESSPSKSRPQANDVSEDLRHLVLGSRKNLCINPKVKNLASATAINERCLELQKPGASADKKCSFLFTKADQAVLNEFRDTAIAEIRDIEDLAAVGKRLGVCPYYASRSAVKPSEVGCPKLSLSLADFPRSSRSHINCYCRSHLVKRWTYLSKTMSSSLTKLIISWIP